MFVYCLGFFKNPHDVFCVLENNNFFTVRSGSGLYKVLCIFLGKTYRVR